MLATLTVSMGSLKEWSSRLFNEVFDLLNKYCCKYPGITLLNELVTLCEMEKIENGMKLTIAVTSVLWGAHNPGRNDSFELPAQNFM